MSEPATIALVRDTCAGLEADAVRYCHFKSNTFLDRSRTAANDLDLLIARAHSDRFAAVMHRLGFKLALKPGALPGVLDYYGFDAPTSRLVHVHAHFQLIVGDDLTKNYRIPLEHAFLEAPGLDGEFRVPAPELELILLVIRLAIKHLTWDAVITKRTRVAASARAELADLTDRAQQARLHDLLGHWLPFVAKRTFDDCLRALAPGAGLGDRVAAGARLTADLRPCARRSRGADISLKFWRRGAGIGRRLRSRPAQRRQLAAGCVIAIVGGDGAGKSTAVQALGDWLGATFDLTQAHLGRPQRSRTTVILITCARARGASLRLIRLIGSRPAPARRTERALLAVAMARDRYLALRRVRRIATNGGIGLCDRFPLVQLTLMDAPRIATQIEADRRVWLMSKLATLEQRYYRAMTPPDVLIVLRVDPEVAVARKPEERPDFVRARWAEIWNVDWASVPAHVIDAGQPVEQVHAELRSLIWSQL